MATRINYTRKIAVYAGEEMSPLDLTRLVDGMPSDTTITLSLDPKVDDKIIIFAQWADGPLESEPAPPVAQCRRHIPLCVERGEHQPPCGCVLPLGHDVPCTSVKW